MKFVSVEFSILVINDIWLLKREKYDCRRQIVLHPFDSTLKILIEIQIKCADRQMIK